MGRTVVEWVKHSIIVPQALVKGLGDGPLRALGYKAWYSRGGPNLRSQHPGQASEERQRCYRAGRTKRTVQDSLPSPSDVSPWLADCSLVPRVTQC